MTSILFDLDGTLVDSSSGIINSFVYAFEKLALPLPNQETLRTFIGPPLEDSFRPYVKDVDNAVAIYRKYYGQFGVFEAQCYPKIVELLETLVNQEHKLYITSSKNEPMIHIMLKHLKIDKYFTGVYGHTAERSNKTEVILACLHSENINLENTLIIGDTKFDIIGGKNAGIKTMGVTWGFGLVSDFSLAGTDSIVHRPLDIIKALESI